MKDPGSLSSPLDNDSGSNFADSPSSNDGDSHSGVFDDRSSVEEFSEISSSSLAILQPVGTGPHGTVHKAIYGGRNLTVKKFHQSVLSDPKFDLSRFKQMMGCILELPAHENVIPVIGVCPNATIITDSPALNSLECVLFKAHNSLTWKAKLKIALDIANGLACLHSNNIVHGNLKGSNVLVVQSILDGSSETAYIARLCDHALDFALCSSGKFHTFRSGFVSPEEAAGEQPSRASDVYSFGILMFELLTGTEAYSDRSTNGGASERAPLHTKVADTSFRPSFQRFLNEIGSNIQKTQRQLIELSQTCWHAIPAERPTSHELVALIRDLYDQLTIPLYMSRFKDLFRGKRQRGTFVLPNKIYGREIECALLRDLLAQNRHNKLRCVFITGPAGIGKSSFVRHVFDDVSELSNGQAVSLHTGKWSQIGNSVAFSGIIQAFKSVVSTRIIEPSGKSPKLALMWKTALQKQLGRNAGLMSNILPDLEILLGRQTKGVVLDCSPEESINRLTDCFIRLCNLVANQDHTIVLFLDDLHCADAASFKVLERIILSNKYVFCVGTYRDTEIDGSHILHKMVDTLRVRSTKVHTIRIGPPSLSDFNQLVADTLHCLTPEQSLPLTEIIYRRSFGNSFFFTQFFMSLHSHHKLITFNDEKDMWEWDSIEKISQLSFSLSNDVVDLMIARLKVLPVKLQLIMKLASVLGAFVNIQMLCVLGKEVHLEDNSVVGRISNKDLSELVESNLFISNGVSLQFVHDRVHQAAFSLWADWYGATGTRIRLQIGQALKANFLSHESPSSSSPTNILFDIVIFMNAGRQLLKTKHELLELAELNQRAAIQARKGSDFSKALYFVRVGVQIFYNQISRILENQTNSALKQKVDMAVATALVWKDDECYPTISSLCLQSATLEAWFSNSSECEKHFSAIRQYARDLSLVAQAFRARAWKLEAQFKHAEALQILQMYFTQEMTPPFGGHEVSDETALALLQSTSTMLSSNDFSRIRNATPTPELKACPPHVVIVLACCSAAGFCTQQNEFAAILSHALNQAFSGEGDTTTVSVLHLSCLLHLSNLVVRRTGDFEFGRQIAQVVAAHTELMQAPDLRFLHVFLARQWSEPLKDTFSLMLDCNKELAESCSNRTALANCTVCVALRCFESGKSVNFLQKKFDELRLLTEKYKMPLAASALHGTHWISLLNSSLDTHDLEKLNSIELSYRHSSPAIVVSNILRAVVFLVFLNGADIPRRDSPLPNKNRLSGSFNTTRTYPTSLSLDSALQACLQAREHLVPAINDVATNALLSMLECVLRYRIASLKPTQQQQEEEDSVLRAEALVAELDLLRQQMPNSIGTYHAMVLAEQMCVLQRQDSDSIVSLYRNVVSLANENGLLWIEAIALERIALFSSTPREVLQGVFKLYEQFGASEKLRFLTTEFRLESSLQHLLQSTLNLEKERRLQADGHVVADNPYSFMESILSEAHNSTKLRKILERYFSKALCVEEYLFLVKLREILSTPVGPVKAKMLVSLTHNFLSDEAPLLVNIGGTQRDTIKAMSKDLENKLQDLSTPGALDVLLDDTVLKDLEATVKSDMVEGFARFKQTAVFRDYHHMSLRRKGPTIIAT